MYLYKNCSFSDEDEISHELLLVKWQGLTQKIYQLRKQQKNAESSLAFRFVEGTLVQAIQNGDWVLLDEINLAMAETLECLSGLLESRSGSVVLMERGFVFGDDKGCCLCVVYCMVSVFCDNNSKYL